MYEYKKINNFEYRFNESNRILNKYKDKYPLIVEKSKDCIYDIQKNKYLVPKDLSIAQFQYVIRKRIKLNSEQALYFLIKGKISFGR